MSLLLFQFLSILALNNVKNSLDALVQAKIQGRAHKTQIHTYTYTHMHTYIHIHAPLLVDPNPQRCKHSHHGCDEAGSHMLKRAHVHGLLLSPHGLGIGVSAQFTHYQVKGGGGELHE